MDLFTLVGTIWRHRIATIPVILITIVGMAYVMVLKPPTYKASAEILLANPPNPPTAAQIAADPALGKINWNNPYLGYGNLVLVADVVIDLVNSAAVQNVLVQQGADPNYTVALDNAFENPPIIQASGTGSSSAAAIKSAQLVAGEVIQSLYQIQAEQQVNSHYMIKGSEFVKPMVATSSSSGKLRSLVAFTALGLILLLIAVSISQSLENRKLTRKSRSRPGSPDAARQHEFSGPWEETDEEQSDRRHGPARMAGSRQVPNGSSRIPGGPPSTPGARPRDAAAGNQGRSR